MICFESTVGKCSSSSNDDEGSIRIQLMFGYPGSFAPCIVCLLVAELYETAHATTTAACLSSAWLTAASNHSETTRSSALTGRLKVKATT